MLYRFTFLISFLLLLASCDKEGKNPITSKVMLSDVRIGNVSIKEGSKTVELGSDITVLFDVAVKALPTSFIVKVEGSNETINFNISSADDGKIITLKTATLLTEDTNYTLTISGQLKAITGASYVEQSFGFRTQKGKLSISSLTHQFNAISPITLNQNINRTPIFEISFNHPVDASLATNSIQVVGKKSYSFSLTNASPDVLKLTLNETLIGFEKFSVLIYDNISTAADSRPFTTVAYRCITAEDPTPKFPIITDDELLTLTQRQTFKYFWNFGHPTSGLARERNTSGNLVTIGGSGFGIMSMIVAVERGFITRAQAVDRWSKIINFLTAADRFHGAWPHWLDGSTGKVIPFSQKDDGGDLIETAFMMQGLLTLRQYLNANDAAEKQMIDRINALWNGVEWSYYTRNQNKLYWHWSPNNNWSINLPITGYNEGLIAYVLAASSPTHTIDKEVYTQGYARNGGMVNNNFYYGIKLPLGFDKGGPLFFSHYSYLGLDPRNLKDQYANYWQQGQAHTLINRAHCLANPFKHVGYSGKCWGLTASDNPAGYNAHSPTNDLGVITPTAALSSMPYAPEESMEALKYFYYTLGDRLWGEYGFYDSFHLGQGWTAASFLAIDQGPIICMIENHRSALLWNLFMSAPEIKQGLDKLGFTY